MKTGAWINYSTGKVFDVDEHEKWLRRPVNAIKLDVPKNVQDAFGEFNPVKERNEFLLYVMKKSPLMRERGHGVFVTFEFATSSRGQVMDAILEFGDRSGFGPSTGLLMNNLETGESAEMNWKTFKEIMDIDGADGIMRNASILQMKGNVIHGFERGCWKGGKVFLENSEKDV